VSQWDSGGDDVTTDAELRRRVEERLQAVLDAREKALWRAPGILGKSNTTGDASVTGRDQWCYVRVGNDETLMTAFNNRTSHRNGLPVYVGYDPLQPTLFQVLSERQVYFQEGSGGKSVAPHHDQHEWGNTEGGEDVVYSRVRQIVDGLVFPTDPASLLVTVRDCVYEIEGTVYYYAGGTVDLTAYVPSTGYQKYVLIAMGPSGPVVTDGTEKSSVALTDVPTASDGSHWPLAAVWLRYSTTEITDWPNTQHILDLRFTGHMANKGWTNLPGVLIVATSGGQYSVVQDAVDAATDGDIVLCMPGTYTGDVTIDKDIGLVGFGIEHTIIAGEITITASGVSLLHLKVFLDENTSDDITCLTFSESTGDITVRECYLYADNAGSGKAVAFYGGNECDSHLYNVRLYATGSTCSAVETAGLHDTYLIGCDIDSAGSTNYDIEVGLATAVYLAFSQFDPSAVGGAGSLSYIDDDEIVASLEAYGSEIDIDVSTLGGTAAADYATNAELSTHAALDTGVHGAGGDTLATDADIDADIATHAALDTGVHGAGGDVLATDADIDADIATHAALDTGVHGAGADTLATDADIATHNAIETAHGIEYLIWFGGYNLWQSGRTATSYDTATLMFDCTINSFHCTCRVNTTNDGSHYWTATLYRRDGTELGSFDTSGIAADTWARLEDTSLANNVLTAATHLALYITWTKTGSPGTLLIHTPVAIATK
jgi:hypothetical protein